MKEISHAWPRQRSGRCLRGLVSNKSTVFETMFSSQTNEFLAADYELIPEFSIGKRLSRQRSNILDIIEGHKVAGISRGKGIYIQLMRS
jgi:hypothetical protein